MQARVVLQQVRLALPLHQRRCQHGQRGDDHPGADALQHAGPPPEARQPWQQSVLVQRHERDDRDRVKDGERRGRDGDAGKLPLHVVALKDEEAAKLRVNRRIEDGGEKDGHHAQHQPHLLHLLRAKPAGAGAACAQRRLVQPAQALAGVHRRLLRLLLLRRQERLLQATACVWAAILLVAVAPRLHQHLVHAHEGRPRRLHVPVAWGSNHKEADSNQQGEGRDHVAD
mmetsp:Transcript_10186/g.26092  ORF Transcript_10186/g.26092 Transcript_10186/m.26092 type:complete len:228 (-) Transcript_10186:718-1401(-)